MYVKKFTLYLLMSIVIMVGLQSPTAFAKIQFVDVSPSHWAIKEINYLVSNRVIDGYDVNGKRHFGPDGLVTREQAAKMLVVASGHEPLVNAEPSFTDWNPQSKLSEYVEKAVELGFFSETSKGKFSPTRPLTRNEMSKVLTKAFDIDPSLYASYEMPFNDIKKGDPYYNYINAIYYNGITIGNNGNYSPYSNVTRAEFASFVARAQSDTYRLGVKGITTPNEADAIGKVVSTADALNVRSSMSTKDPNNIVGQVNKGVQFNVYELKNGWFTVSYDNKFAYISATYAQLVDETPKPEPIPEPQPQPSALIGRATVDNLNVREGASASSESLGVLNRGNEVTVLSISGTWAKVRYNGKEGYINKVYLKLTNQSSPAVHGKIIAVDPGHGGKDAGATGGSAAEKAVVLKVSNLVKQKLEKDGAIVKMTRTDDTYPSLGDRVQFAKDNFAEVFVSIHVNSATNTDANGTETYYSISANENEKEDLQLATNINNQIVANANMRNRGVKTANFYVIRNSDIPSVLVELGFISNTNDRAKLVNDQYVEIFADSIYKGIVQYYSK